MISQMDLVTGILGLLEKHGVKDGNSRHFNAVIAAATSIIAEFSRPNVLSAPGMGLAAWLRSDDTGLSSKHMARILCNIRVDCDIEEVRTGKPPHPLDPDDFGRCYRFLRAVPIGPERARGVAYMGNSSREWAGLTAAWDELEKLYEEELPTGKCPKLYARMKEIINAAKEAK